MSDLDEEEVQATREMKQINKIIAPEEKRIKIKTKFICFSDRRKIEKMFIKYCEEKYVPKTLFNLITFLQIKDLLNRDKIKELQEKRWLDE